MPKPVRSRRKRKHLDEDTEKEGKDQAAKRHKKQDAVTATDTSPESPPNEHFYLDTNKAGDGALQPLETEYFGTLSSEEAEYFHSADEILELDQFPGGDDERRVFVANVWKEARGKELKMASSWRCSRLVERLVGLGTSREVKHLFGAFAGHFLSLVRHRFASHCVEALIVRAAPMVTRELGGGDEDEEEEKEKEKETMEQMFLLTLDELDGSIQSLATDQYGSHAIRVLLVVLSGRPLEDASVKWLIKSRKKENNSATARQEPQGPQGPRESQGSREDTKQGRAVPASFGAAVRKMIQDATANMDTAAARALARDPVGNPTLQLLLQLDLSINKSSTDPGTLLGKMLPGAPQTLADPQSDAARFVDEMLQDPVGARLIETLIPGCSGKVFKALQAGFFGPRVQELAGREVSSYATVRALSRLSRDDLVSAVHSLRPTMARLVSRQRWNVVRALFERCAARKADDELPGLTDALVESCGGKTEDLVRRLCYLDEAHDDPDEQKAAADRARYAKVCHGAGVIGAMLLIPGPPSQAAQAGILALTPQQLARLSTACMPTVSMLTTALSSPPHASSMRRERTTTRPFHPLLVSALEPLLPALAVSQYGHNLAKALASARSTGPGRAAPMHVKERMAEALSRHEREMKMTWMGRSVWRTWKVEMWMRKRADWKQYIRELDGADEQQSNKP